MILVFLGALCSVLIAHLLKWNSHKPTREPQIYWVNYLIATILCFLASSERQVLLDPEVLPELAFAGLIGVFYVSNLIFMAKSVATNGIGLTLSVMRLSLVFPVLFSVYFFHESLSGIRLIGLLVAFLALLVLFNPSQGSAQIQGSTSTHRNLRYLAIIFLITWLVMSAIIVKQPLPWPNRHEWIAGVWIGLPNVAGTAFMLAALTTIPASVAFPVSNLSIIILGTLLGRVYWNDTLTTRQYSVIALCILAIFLLTI